MQPGTDLGTTTDSTGRFTLAGLKAGTLHLEASALGYRPALQGDIAVTPGKIAEVEFMLESIPIESAEATVKARFYRPTPAMLISGRSLASEEIRRAPGAAEDIQRAIQALPGVASANDMTNEIVVRGGDPTENLTVIDGIEVDNTNHFPDQSSSGGPISAVNIGFVREIDFGTGGFSARYGDRLSSVLAIDLRDGNRSRRSGEVSVSMAGAGLDLEGPTGIGDGTYLFSARKSYLDLIKGPIGLTAVPHYWDAQAKVSFTPSPLLRASLFTIWSRDWISIEADDPDAWSRGAETVDAKYGRSAIGLRLRHLRRTGYDEWVAARLETMFDERAYEMPDRRLEFLNQSTEVNYQLNYARTGKGIGRDDWTVGIGLKPVSFELDRWFEQDTVGYDFDDDGVADTTVVSPPWFIRRSGESLKRSAFAEYRWRPAMNLTVAAGLRYDGFDLSGRDYLAPRLALRIDLNPRTTLTFATGRYYQAPTLIVYHYDPLGGNEKLPHRKSDHYIAGLNYLLRPSTLASIEIYQKDYRDLPVFEEDIRRSSDPTFRSWRHLPVGSRQSRGLELLLQQKMESDWYGTIGYSYGRSRTDNSLEEFPADYDFRHVGTIVAGWTTSLIRHSSFNRFQRAWYGWWTWLLPLNADEITPSVRWRYVSGRPLTPRIWTVAGPELDYHWVDGVRNSARYPDYSRLDVRWDAKWLAGRGAVVVFLEVQNLFDRPNVAEYIYGDDGSRTTAYQFRFFFIGGVKAEF